MNRIYGVVSAVNGILVLVASGTLARADEAFLVEVDNLDAATFLTEMPTLIRHGPNSLTATSGPCADLSRGLLLLKVAFFFVAGLNVWQYPSGRAAQNC